MVRGLGVELLSNGKDTSLAWLRWRKVILPRIAFTFCSRPWQARVMQVVSPPAIWRVCAASSHGCALWVACSDAPAGAGRRGPGAGSPGPPARRQLMMQHSTSSRVLTTVAPARRGVAGTVASSHRFCTVSVDSCTLLLVTTVLSLLLSVGAPLRMLCQGQNTHTLCFNGNIDRKLIHQYNSFFIFAVLS